MAQLLIVIVVVAVVAAVAALARRRAPDGPTQSSFRAPDQLDRADFAGPDVELLVVAFTSTDCHSCPAAADDARASASATTEVVVVSVEDEPELHSRYNIDAVPTIVVADAQGVVRRAFVGGPPPGALAAAIGELQSFS